MGSERGGGDEPSALSQEDLDFENVVKNRHAGKVDEWPNAAGFEGLTEVRGPVALKVEGSIPPWAAGSLYRTGPGSYSVENTPKGTFNITHWFDGFAHTHRFKITPDPDVSAGVRVEYSSRYQSEDHVEAIRQKGEMRQSFGQRLDPCIGLFSKAMSVFRNEEPKTRNICVAVHANLPGFSASGSGHKTIHVTTDTSVSQEIHPETLEPIGLARQTSLHPLLKGPLSSAHAQHDPVTGDVFNFNLELGRRTTYRIFRTNAKTGKTDILATISDSTAKPAYIHSFFLSPSFVILCIPSSHLSYGGISVPWNGNLTDAMTPFNTSLVSKWFVVDRLHDRGVIATFDTPAGFFFHSINAFEEHDVSRNEITVVCDSIEYPTTDIIRAYEMDVLLHRNTAFIADEARVRNSLQRLVRHRFRVYPSLVTPQRIEATKEFEIKAPYAGELPTINPRFATRDYRFVYSLSTHGLSTLHDTIVKTDLVTRESVSWQGPAGHTPGEAIFVPRPEDGEEDDGVLLSVILDHYGQCSYLLCLDARTMNELGRAVCEWPIGHGFHGLHVEGDVSGLGGEPTP